MPWSKAERCCDGTSHGSFGLMQASRRDKGTAWPLSRTWPTPYPHCALPVPLMLRRLQQGLQTGYKTMFWRAAPQRRCCVLCRVAFSPIVNIKEACSCVRHFRFRTLVRRCDPRRLGIATQTNEFTASRGFWSYQAFGFATLLSKPSHRP